MKKNREVKFSSFIHAVGNVEIPTMIVVKEYSSDFLDENVYVEFCTGLISARYTQRKQTFGDKLSGEKVLLLTRLECPCFVGKDFTHKKENVLDVKDLELCSYFYPYNDGTRLIRFVKLRDMISPDGLVSEITLK